MSNKFYITTPIYYVNAAPHIGHSYTNIAADALARFMRRRLGDGSVWFLTGTDEHGQKIQKAADAQGLTAQVFVDNTVAQFKNLWQKLDISHNDFIRTTDPRHISTVQRVLDILYKKGDIYQAEYSGWYCTPCETFWVESQLTDKICPDCKRPVEKITEINYFFKLRQHQEWLIKYIEEHKDFICPEIRRNEVLSFLRMNELTDLCISRPKERLSWGITLPFSPGHVTYVWFDALINYISAVGEFDNAGVYHSKWWPADVHLMAKDILRQHAVYWPIILRALNMELPKTLLVHGWWMIADTKMSKSLGNVVSPIDMAEKYGIDTYKYFLLRELPFGLDGNFSESALVKRFNSDLANDLGNLVYRVLTMIEKYYQGNVPEADSPKDRQAEAINERLKNVSEEINKCLSWQNDYNFSAALEKIWVLINSANKYIEETKPWNLVKENKIDELKCFIRFLTDVIRAVASELLPFLPQTAASILAQIGKDTIAKGSPLFPRIDTKKT